MKKLIIVTVFTLLCFLFCGLSYGQNKERVSDSYNLPPGFVFSKKFITTLDLSYKLNGISNSQTYHDNDLRIGKNFSNDQLLSLKEIDQANYKYYTTANIYFESLSKKIKEMYTVNELWYIYVFDQNLKNKLLTIK
jgi:hypothetical protein